jgi:hypothetical protein
MAYLPEVEADRLEREREVRVALRAAMVTPAPGSPVFADSAWRWVGLWHPLQELEELSWP